MPWTIRKAAFSEIAGSNITEFSERFRGTDPVLIVYPLTLLPWTGVIKCAPLNFALCAAGWSRPLDLACSEWVRRKTVINNETFKLFQREIAALPSSPESAPREFLSVLPWNHVEGSRAWERRFGKNQPYLGRGRVFGFVVPNRSVEAVIQLCNEELESYGEHAFVAAHEGIEKGRTWPNRRNDGYDPFQILDHVPRHIVTDENTRQAILRELYVAMQAGLGTLEKGQSWEPDLFYLDRINPPAWFILGSEGVMNYPADAVEAEIYAMRARIIRLLGWPQAYTSVSTALEQFDSQSKQFPLRFRMPFDIRHELSSYLAETEARYPALSRNVQFPVGEA